MGTCRKQKKSSRLAWSLGAAPKPTTTLSRGEERAAVATLLFFFYCGGQTLLSSIPSIIGESEVVFDNLQCANNSFKDRLSTKEEGQGPFSIPKRRILAKKEKGGQRRRGKQHLHSAERSKRKEEGESVSLSSFLTSSSSFLDLFRYIRREGKGKLDSSLQRQKKKGNREGGLISTQKGEEEGSPCYFPPFSSPDLFPLMPGDKEGKKEQITSTV